MILNLQTKAGFLDDDQEYLDSLESNFSSRLQDSIYSINYQNFFQKISDKILPDCIDVLKLKEIMLNKDNSSYFTVIIVDQNMPGITGLELLDEIKSKNVYKILNTGYADDKVAIKALNEKKIDFFLNKNASINTLYDAIKTGEKYVLQRISEKFLEKIDQNAEIISILNSKSVIDKFSEIIKRYKIKEYCLMDLNGAYRMTSNDQVYTLLVMNIDSIPAQIEVLESMGADNNIIQEVKERRRMLYLPLLDYDKFEAREYHYYLFPCEIIEDQQYTASFVKGDIFINL